LTKTLVNINLVPGVCPICHGPNNMDPTWAGINPTLGTECRSCSTQQKEQRRHVFHPQHVELVIEKEIRFSPWLGVYEYDFDWSGSTVMLNGLRWTIRTCQADMAWVVQEDAVNRAMNVYNLGYWDLLRIYAEAGGETTPPPLNLTSYTPTPIQLLDKPIVKVHLNKKDGLVYSVRVGGYSTKREIPHINTLHLLCNMYVVEKFSLDWRPIAEGGFGRDNIEIRNLDTIGVYRCDHARDQRYSKAERQVLTNIFEAWKDAMETLLRYNWHELPEETPEDTWHAFCRMCDLLLHIMPPPRLRYLLNKTPYGDFINV
jgi:hypothetical protein